MTLRKIILRKIVMKKAGQVFSLAVILLMTFWVTGAFS
jgi:hypothetical protein